MSVCSCVGKIFHHIDELPYLYQMNVLIDGEERSYELLHTDREYVYQSFVQLNPSYYIDTVYTGTVLYFYLRNEYDYEQSKFGFGFRYEIEDTCFIEGKKYFLSDTNLKNLEEGWFSLYTSEEPGIAFSMVFEITHSKPTLYFEEEAKSLSGTIVFSEDFVGYKSPTYVYDKSWKLIEKRGGGWKGEDLLKKE